MYQIKISRILFILFIHVVQHVEEFCKIIQLHDLQNYVNNLKLLVIAKYSKRIKCYLFLRLNPIQELVMFIIQTQISKSVDLNDLVLDNKKLFYFLLLTLELNLN